MEQQPINQMLTVSEWPTEGLEKVSDCPICGCQDRSILHMDLTDRVMYCAPGFWILYRCHKCNSAYLDPRPTEQTINLAYSDYYTHVVPEAEIEAPQIPLGRLRFALRNGYLNLKYGYNFSPANKIGYYLEFLFPWRKSREDRWIRHLSRPSQTPRLLDVGCGNGAFLKRMQISGWAVQGIDPDPKAVELGRNSDLPIIQGTLNDNVFENNFFDAVTINHVLEHIYNPHETLRECYRILRPGGILWLATPNLNSCGHKTFGIYWLGLDPPRHLCLFTEDSLKTVMENAGFVIYGRTHFSPKANGMFRDSASISKGLSPFDETTQSPIHLRWKAYFADLRAWLHPELSEELVMIARKPAEKQW